LPLQSRAREGALQAAPFRVPTATSGTIGLIGRYRESVLIRSTAEAKKREAFGWSRNAIM